MALTITNVVRGHFGNRKATVATVEFDSSYVTGGEPFVPADVGMESFDVVLVTPAANGTEAVVVKHDPAAETLQVFWGGGAVSSELDEVTSTDNLSGFEATVFAVGTGN